MFEFERAKVAEKRADLRKRKKEMGMKKEKTSPKCMESLLKYKACAQCLFSGKRMSEYHHVKHLL